MYFLQNTCTFFLTSDPFELLRSLIRTNESLPRSSELQARGIWRRSTELLVFRILWHLVFRIFKSSDAGDVHQNFCLQNLQHLIRNTSSEAGTCSSELPVSESSEWLLGKSSELTDADYLLIRNTSSEAF